MHTANLFRPATMTSWVVFGVTLFLMTGVARADILSGYLEWDYNMLNSTTNAASAGSSNLKSDNLTQRYSLSLDTRLFPNLKLTSGAIFENEKNWLNTDGSPSDSSTTTLRPHVDLTLNTLLYNAGIGYNRREEKTSASNVPTSTQINEDYHALLGWRPEGLPTTDLQLIRTNNYDANHIMNDTTDDRATLGMRYLPVKNVDLRYQGVYDDSTDKLTNFEVRQLTNTGRVAYSDQFFNDRVSLNTNYNITVQQTKNFGTGTVFFPLYPGNGLSALNDMPLSGALDTNAALIDGNLSASSGVNIGAHSAGTIPQLRNIGVDYFTGTEVSRIIVWLDRELPVAVGDLFTLNGVVKVYTSSDNLNWTLVTDVSPGAAGGRLFENFSNPGITQGRFVIDVSPLTTQFIKVVFDLSSITVDSVRIAAPGFQPPDQPIFVTEMQTFDKKPASELKGTTTRTTQTMNMDLKTRILDSPSLYYDFSLFLTRSDPDAFTRYTLSNGLYLDHRFNEVFSGNASVAREDGEEATGHRVSYVYSASLRAVPLKTLSHTLVYSGRTEQIAGKSSDTNSITLYNTAELYQGVNLNLAGGASFANADAGLNSETENFLFGASIIPHKTLTLNLNYTANRTRLWGGTTLTPGFTTQRGELSAAYRPFPALYLFGSIGITELESRTDTLQNYGVNWSPFPDGTLQFNFAYNESLSSENNQKERLITPSLTWKVTRKSILDLAYILIRSDSTLQTNYSKILSASLRIFF